MLTGQQGRGFLPHLGHLHGHAAADRPGGWRKPAFQHHGGEPGSAPPADSRLERRCCTQHNHRVAAETNYNSLCVCVAADAASSRMFEGFPDELMEALAQEPLTGNFHHYGVTVKVTTPTHTPSPKISRNINIYMTTLMIFQTFLANKRLQSFFSVLSTNVAENGVHFVSTIEGKNRSALIEN